MKKYGGQIVLPGNIIIRQRGTKIFPGENVKMGKDHLYFSVVKGTVVFKKKKSDRTFVSVNPINLNNKIVKVKFLDQVKIYIKAETWWIWFT